MAYQSFTPPARTLMGPGPSDLHPRVLAALGRPIIGHLDPAFVAMMEEMKGLLQYVFRTQNALTLPISAPGSAGMEACFVNLIEPGDQVVVCINGVFGNRMLENVKRFGGIPVVVEDTWGTPVSLDQVEQSLRSNPDAKILAFVHAETSTGVRSDAAGLCALAQQHGCLSIVDTVTSLGGCPVEVDLWGADAVYSGSQKCLSCTPGLAPVTFSDRAVQRIQQRKTPVPSWFLDLNLLMGYWIGSGGKRAYHHTAPINALYALHEALLLLHEEGIDQVWARHLHHHQALSAGLEAMGLEFLVAPDFRLPQLNAIKIPEGVDDVAIRTALLHSYGLEIGAGLGPLAGRVWRIGLMGHSANERNVLLCLSALESALAESGRSRPGPALAAAQDFYRQARGAR